MNQSLQGARFHAASFSFPSTRIADSARTQVYFLGGKSAANATEPNKKTRRILATNEHECTRIKRLQELPLQVCFLFVFIRVHSWPKSCSSVAQNVIPNRNSA